MARIYHPWTAWECVPAGMYAEAPPAGMSSDEAKQAYCDFLQDLPRFQSALQQVLAKWPVSCEHFLSNSSSNRIAWLGQASMCIATGVPAKYRGGFHLLSPDQQRAANAEAARALHKWSTSRGFSLSSGEASSPNGQTFGGVGLHARVRAYARLWESRGYPEGMPQEVPPELERRNLAPSWRALAIAILRNDHGLISLGGSPPPPSRWYGVLKRMELRERGALPQDPQLPLL